MRNSIRIPEIQIKIIETFKANPWCIKKLAKELSLNQRTISKFLHSQGFETHKGRPRLATVKAERGYKFVFAPNHPQASKRGYVYEHIFKATKALGRALKSKEIVHHINGNTSDNRNENLLICDRSYHSWLHAKMSELYQKEHFAG